MNKIGIFVTTALLAASASPSMAQEVIYNPGYCAQFYPNANCQNGAPMADPIPANSVSAGKAGLRAAFPPVQGVRKQALECPCPWREGLSRQPFGGCTVTLAAAFAGCEPGDDRADQCRSRNRERCDDTAAPRAGNGGFCGSHHVVDTALGVLAA